MLQVCRRLLQELSRHERARCREHSQVTPDFRNVDIHLTNDHP